MSTVRGATAIKLRDLFFDSEPPGLLFSTIYLRGTLAPSPFSSLHSELGLPPLINCEKREASRQSLRKDPLTSFILKLIFL
jgi:hypothetical protein